MTSPRPQHHTQRMIGLRGPAMLLLAAVALAALPAPAAAVKAISPFSEGIITHFGGAQDGEQGWGRLLGGWRVRTCGGGGTGGGARAASWWRQRWNNCISAASLLVDGHSPMGCCRAVAVGGRRVIAPQAAPTDTKPFPPCRPSRPSCWRRHGPLLPLLRHQGGCLRLWRHPQGQVVSWLAGCARLGFGLVGGTSCWRP